MDCNFYLDEDVSERRGEASVGSRPSSRAGTPTSSRRSSVSSIGGSPLLPGGSKRAAEEENHPTPDNGDGKKRRKERPVERSMQNALELRVELQNIDPFKVKETRGRKTLTPEHQMMFTTEVRQAREAAKKAERDRQIDELIIDETVPPTGARSVKAQENAAEKAFELREVPTTAVAAEATRYLATLQKVAGRSRNIKGSLLKEIWEAVETLMATNSVLTRRALSTGDLRASADDGTGRLKDELEGLRGVVQSQKGEIDRLGRELEVARAGGCQAGKCVPAPSTPLASPVSLAPSSENPKPQRARRSGRLFIRDDSEEEDGRVPMDTEHLVSGGEIIPLPEPECRRMEILEEIEREERPAVVRPPLRGDSRCIEPPTPPQPLQQQPGAADGPQGLAKQVAAIIAATLPQVLRGMGFAPPAAPRTSGGGELSARDKKVAPPPPPHFDVLDPR